MHWLQTTHCKASLMDVVFLLNLFLPLNFHWICLHTALCTTKCFIYLFILFFNQWPFVSHLPCRACQWLSSGHWFLFLITYWPSLRDNLEVQEKLSRCIKLITWLRWDTISYNVNLFFQYSNFLRQQFFYFLLSVICEH